MPRKIKRYSKDHGNKITNSVEYARPSQNPIFRYGFSFDVRKLREKFENRMPSAEFSNVSIPMTFGDVVQQGRTKTYVRHSFNRNNKKGGLDYFKKSLR